MPAESRIARRFGELRAAGERALIAYVTAGDPDLETTLRAVLALSAAGADIIEIGIPFSDPLLDGPVIQAASQRALDHGTRVSQVFDLVRAIRRESDVPLLFMTCLNPIRRIGEDDFAATAAKAGLDGVLVTDLPPEEADKWVGTAARHSLDRIFILAPTSPPQRIAAAATAASGFIYCQSRAGVTGERKSVPADLGDLVRRVRACTALPLAVGFGISTPEHVRAVTSVADGAVVGTALVSLIGGNPDSAEHGVARAVELTRLLKSATRARASVQPN